MWRWHWRWRSPRWLTLVSKWKQLFGDANDEDSLEKQTQLTVTLWSGTGLWLLCWTRQRLVVKTHLSSVLWTCECFALEVTLVTKWRVCALLLCLDLFSYCQLPLPAPISWLLWAAVSGNHVFGLHRCCHDYCPAVLSNPYSIDLNGLNQ